MFRSAVLHHLSTAAMVVGVLFIFGVGLWAEPYTAQWIDTETGCTPRGACEDPDMLRTGWWLVAAGSAVALIGVALRWLALKPASEAAESPQARSAMLAGRGIVWASMLTAIIAAAIGLATLLMITIGLGSGSDQGAFAVLWAGALGQAFAVAEVAATVRSTARSPRSAWAMGFGAGAVAAGAAALVALDVIDVAGGSSWWIVIAWTVGATVVAAISWAVGAMRTVPTIA